VSSMHRNRRSDYHQRDLDGRQEGEDRTQSWIRHHDNYPA
jgi:hypothetical protein